MRYHTASDIRIILPEEALMSIFDECDRYNNDETGGRFVGTFKEEAGNLTLQIAGLIDAGPGAQRTRVSLFQDGPYQETIFRRIEREHPEMEHLGSWHTHHVNGLLTLSDGDLTTYRRTVNHANHNPGFFYALLVTTRNDFGVSRERYSIKHFVFRRDDDRVYEVPPRFVRITNTPLVRPAKVGPSPLPIPVRQGSDKTAAERLQDRDFLGDVYAGVRACAAEKLGFFWRGPLELVDGSQIDTIVLEDAAESIPKYLVTIRKPPAQLKDVVAEIAATEFASARAAMFFTERSCNRVLFQQRNKA